MNTTEQLVKQVLEDQFNLTVQKIPECESRTPDFYATSGSGSYLIEVKEKVSDPNQIQSRNAAFDRDDLFEMSQSLSAKSVLEDKIRDGKRQISEHVKNEGTFRIVWVHCTGLGYSATSEQIFSGIYGSETVVDWGSERSFSGTCYYFHESQFYKYRDSIDAVIISTKDEKIKMCLNDHSPRYEALKLSVLASGFERGLCDPREQEANGEAYIVNDPVDRQNQQAVINYLSKKYGAEKLMAMPMQSFEAHVAVPSKLV